MCRSTTSSAGGPSSTCPWTFPRSVGSWVTSPTAATRSFCSPIRSIDLDRPRPELVRVANDVLQSLHAAGHVEVDHVELFGPPTSPTANARNFVLCPSGTYDRSPCGTGTSAKVAAMAADGLLREGATWVQESITGSQFTVRYRWHDQAAGSVVPTITVPVSAVADRTRLPRTQRWTRTGPLRRPQLHRLAPPRHINGTGPSLLHPTSVRPKDVDGPLGGRFRGDENGAAHVAR